MQREQAEILIQQLGAAVGMPLELDEAGMCLLALEDDTLVTLGYDVTSERLVLMTPLDAVESNEATLRAMLRANFLWHATEGATLALEPSGGAALLQRALPDDLDAAGLQAAFDAFAEQALAWNRDLAETLESAGTSDATPATPGLMLRV